MLSGKANDTLFFFRMSSRSQFLLITGLSLLLYLPILTNSFVNDDFIVLNRLGPDRQFLVTGFFRPLSDLTLWLTWQLAGLHAWPYYLTGIIGHAVAVYCLLQLCLSWRWARSERQQQSFALLAALFFLTYPFHNESVAWILGRGALMANTLGILALCLLIRPGKEVVKMAGVAGCYFIGLAAYESVAVLPGMIVLYLLIERRPAKLVMHWVLALGGTLGLHALLRRMLSGSVAGSYGEGFMQGNPIRYVLGYTKALARAFLPPMQNGLAMAIAFAVFLLVLGVVIFILSKTTWRSNFTARRFFLVLAGCLLIALLVPAVGAVSTHTSESDRLLHFPSFFVAMMLAYLLVVLFGNSKMGWYLAAVLLVLQVYLLEANNLRWRKASEAVRYVLAMASTADANRPLYIINLPEQINGAFVFRVGFEEALRLNDIKADHIFLLRLPGGMPAGIPDKASVINWTQEGWQKIR